MSLSVIVCDDSKFARSQLIKGLPKDLKKNLKEVSDGLQALELIRSGFGELMFLDLNMPNMDGYQVLEEIKKAQLDILVIVITGDIQAAAEKKIMSLGALAYLKKPLDFNSLFEVLKKYGLADELETEDGDDVYVGAEVTYRDKLQEVLNISTGKAAKQLGDLLNIFINLPIPVVSELKGRNLCDDIKYNLLSDDDILIGAGFSGSCMNGEILISYSADCIDNLLHLLVDDSELVSGRKATMIELSNLVISTLMNGVGEQLGVQFSRTHPSIVRLSENIQLLSPELSDKGILNVKMVYTIPDRNIDCVLYLLFTEDSLPHLEERLSYI